MTVKIFLMLVLTPPYVALIIFLAKILFILLELIVDDIEKEKRKKTNEKSILCKHKK